MYIYPGYAASLIGVGVFIKAKAPVVMIGAPPVSLPPPRSAPSAKKAANAEALPMGDDDFSEF